MRVLVTGGLGFIGSHVVDKLRDRGFEVCIYDLKNGKSVEGVEHYNASLLDVETLRIAMNGADAVYHLAAVADVNDVVADPSYAEMINVRGTLNVLEAARRAKVRRVIYGSTTWVYSECEGDAVDEDTPPRSPKHLYTTTKLASEMYCMAYREMYGMETTILRYGIPYGPRARGTTVLAIFVQKALRGEPLSIAGDGSQFRKFIYVEDLAEGNVLALHSVARNRVYNLDGAEKITIRQIAETVNKFLGPIRIEYGPARPGDFAGKEVSTARAARELAWTPRVPFEEGVRRYIEWLRQASPAPAVSGWASVDKALAAGVGVS